jgi:hypothetical protein
MCSGKGVPLECIGYGLSTFSRWRCARLAFRARGQLFVHAFKAADPIPDTDISIFIVDNDLTLFSIPPL